jgi:hypothetical protein
MDKEEWYAIILNEVKGKNTDELERLLRSGWF